MFLRFGVSAGLVVVVAAILVFSPIDGGEFSANAVTTTPSPWAEFSGNVCYYSDCGASAAGRQVVAKMNGVTCATTESTLHEKENVVRYALRIDFGSPSGCGENGGPVEFFIDGERVPQTAVWTYGYSAHQTLWVGPEFAAFSGPVYCLTGETCFGCTLDGCETFPLVEAFVDGNLCGSKRATHGGVVPAITLMVVRSLEDTIGCGTTGAEIRIKVDGRPAETVLEWRPGFYQTWIYFDPLSTPDPIQPSSSATPASPAATAPESSPTPAMLPNSGGSPPAPSKLPAWVLGIAAVLITTSLASFAASRRL